MILDACIEQIDGAIRELRPVELRGFGSFTYRLHQKRYGRSPHRTGGDPHALIEIPAHYVVKFKPHPNLKRAVVSRRGNLFRLHVLS